MSWTRAAAAALGAACLAVGLLAYGLAWPSATLLAPALVRLPGNGGAREAALTFDDGPTPRHTPRILDILRASGVRATFFLCGESAERHPDLVRRIQAEGHAIGNHTYSHPYLHLMSRGRIADEIERAQEALARITGRRPTLFRPPYGVRWFTLGSLLRERGMTMVMWSAGEPEGSRDADSIARTALAGLRPGAIILLHDGYEARLAPQDRSATVEALPAIIAGAKRAGYRFVAIPR